MEAKTLHVCPGISCSGILHLQLPSTEYIISNLPFVGIYFQIKPAEHDDIHQGNAAN